MRPKIEQIKQPLIDEESDPESFEKNNLGGKDMNNIAQKISLEHVSLEQRRREAKKPLYLVRYE